MDFISTQKFILESPRKLRPVAYLIRRMKVSDALNALPFMKQKGAGTLTKVIKNAVSASKEKGVSEIDLIFKEIQIGEGPRLKRGNPVSRGQWHPIKKRMSHIRVVLTTLNKEKKNGTKN